ncbi:MAG: riboflavin synthase [Calditrichaeota bacterium]|nr:MAG: riboflavin synthase [Calditrichota bacterium]
MFTGLVEEIGEIKNISQSRGARRLSVAANLVFSQLKIDDSIAINGTCLTVINIENSTFEVEAVEETLKVTTLGSLYVGQKVNLERALRADSRLGGHFVQGHVDAMGTVTNFEQQHGGKRLSIKIPPDLRKYIIPKGSISIDGCSLTIATIKNEIIQIALIPHTLAVTTLGHLKIGAKVNIETDMLGKYACNLLEPAINKPEFFSQFKIKMED